MKLKSVLTLFILISHFAFGQNQIKMTNEYGSENDEIQNLFEFEGIFLEKLIFENDNLNGKFYEINLQEFSKGKLLNSYLLFDASESDYFKISENKLSLSFYFKLEDKKLKTFIVGKNFRSKKSYFDLKSEADDYALKDFFGRNEELFFDINSKNQAVFAIITPAIHKDGSSGYCEVAQADIKPEKLGEHFKIPHYYIVTIQFK